ncbi:hypothetical protein P1P68_00250 [Streptomyces scabiei]|uniref:hypothetical protein n=1 Tax=Streptomyces scabiei TaxID=1930 RepID=UPI002990772A|nr:hypothetical protein [Streptomyces scabiei]MDW8803280.1 hypothetical protein [Streptomyces scabiei]
MLDAQQCESAVDALPASRLSKLIGLHGSASDDPTNAWMTPYDVKWGYLVNFDHEFPGKAALQKIKQDGSPRTTVTPEWNADDIGAAYAARFRGKDAVVYDRMSNDPVISIDDYHKGRMRIDYVLKDGEKVGVATVAHRPSTRAR